MTMNDSKKSQLDRFKEAAREIGTDNDEERFNKKLRKMVKGKPKDDKTPNDLPGLSRIGVIT